MPASTIYEFTDIPAGMTCREYRRQIRAPRHRHRRVFRAARGSRKRR